MSVAESLVAGPIVVDLRSRRAHAGGRELLLTRREFDLLTRLARDADRVLTKHELLRDVWGCGPGTRTLERHIHTLRHKLGAEGTALVTVWGVGYRLEAGRRPVRT